MMDDLKQLVSNPDLMKPISDVISNTDNWLNAPASSTGEVDYPPLPECEICGGYGVVVKEKPNPSNNYRSKMMDCPAPNCEAAQILRERRIKRLFGYTTKESITNLRAFTFDSFSAMPAKFTEGKEHAWAAAYLFADLSPRGFSMAEAAEFVGERDHRKEVYSWLTLTGPNGTGKTSLAAAAVNHLHNRGEEAMLMRWDELYGAIKDAYGEGDFSESFILGEVCGIKVLVMDEITVAGITENMRRVMEFIVRHRAMSGLPTMFTTNWSEGELARQWGNRIATILKANHIIGVGGLSLRADNKTVWGFSNGE